MRAAAESGTIRTPWAAPGHLRTRSARLDDPTQSAETGDVSAPCVVPARRDRARCLAPRPGTDTRRLHGARDERFAKHRWRDPGAGRRALWRLRVLVIGGRGAVLPGYDGRVVGRDPLPVRRHRWGRS